MLWKLLWKTFHFIEFEGSVTNISIISFFSLSPFNLRMDVCNKQMFSVMNVGSGMNGFKYFFY